VTQTALRGRHLFSVLSAACDLLHNHQSPSSTAVPDRMAYYYHHYHYDCISSLHLPTS
jgi:hypothetical protein